MHVAHRARSQYRHYLSGRAVAMVAGEFVMRKQAAYYLSGSMLATLPQSVRIIVLCLLLAWWSLGNQAYAQTIAAGETHACTVASTGALVCWGVNNAGQIGDGTTITRTTPTNINGVAFNSISITAGSEHTCAVSPAGAVKCWGANNRGQLGDGTTVQKQLPTSVSLTGQSAVAAGKEHSCALGSGGVTCWGYNNDGQLGLGGLTDANPHPIPNSVPSLSSGVIFLTAGYNHNCAITASGAAKCWGAHDWYQLGAAGFEDFYSTSPVDVAGLSSGVTAIAGGDRHTCAVVSAGIKCWGDNFSGQIGDGSNELLRKTPAEVQGLSSGMIAVSAGSAHTCALSSTGAVYCWGDNSFGQLGNGSATSSNVPVLAVSNGATAVATGAAHTCALLGAGGSVCWGGNPTGQMGNGTVGGQYYVPVSTQYPSSTATVLSTSGTPSVFGDNVTFTATVTGGVTGAAVAFQSEGVIIAGCGAQALSSGIATCTTSLLGGGTYSLVAIYQGTTATLASSSAGLSQVVSKADQTITFDPLADKVDNDADFNLVVSTSSGLAVTFSSLTLSVCTVTGSTVDILSAGVCTIAANQAGNSNYNVAPQVAQSFTVASSGPALALTAVQSRKTHGAAGDFDIPITTGVSIGGTISVESRAIGSGHRIVFQFNIPITATGTAAAIDSMSSPIGSVSTMISGNDVVVTLTGVPDNRRVTISLTNVNGIGVDANVSVGFLVGDSNGSRSVNITDVNGVKIRSGQATSAGNFRFDTNASGTINITDINAIKIRSGLSL